MEGGDVQKGQPPAPPTTPNTLQALAVDGQKHLESVVEAAHDILQTLNRALCSPSFWVSPSLLAGNVGPGGGGGEGGSGGAGAGDGGGAKEKRADDGEGLAALDATRVRYKAATGALRATVAAIVKQLQASKAEGEGGAAENVDTGEVDYLEQRAAELREEVEKKNQVLKLHIDQLRSLIADISMWQAAGL